MAGARQPAEGRPWLKVCVGCNRYLAGLGGAGSLGESLALTLEAGLRGQPLGERLILRRVPCLSGCRRPGNVSVGALGKCKLRLHDIGCSDAEAILELAQACLLSPDGEPATEDWPESLKTRLAALVRPHYSDAMPPAATRAAGEFGAACPL